MYASLGNYNVLALQDNFTPENYMEAIGVCENAGMEVIIIDSISQSWDNLLEYHANLQGNSFTNWQKVTPRINAFIQKILKSVMEPADLSCCRLIFGEADTFPGLTVDRFGDVLVPQVLSLGIERRKEQIFSALVQILREDGQTIRGIYERNDVALREKEGLQEYKGWFPLPGETPPAETVTEITENGVRYRVDFENGQKTGFFLDQKYNRRAVGRLARGKTVLDCFTHTGSFALNAALGGAAHVTAVDVSESAVAMARQNAVLNGLTDRMDFLAADVFDLLPQLSGQPRRYAFIILDPPAFTKSRKTIHSAMKGYKEINYRAMKLLPRGGYLATCSCSHFAYDDLFRKMLADAAHDAGVQLRQIEARQQSADHPILWGVPETNYLKFYLFQVV